MDFSVKWGKDVDETVRLALKELNLTRNEVDIFVLQHPTKGLFGIGSKLAKVKVERKPDEIKRVNRSPYDVDIEELTKKAQEESDAAYKYYLSNVNNVNPHELDLTNVDHTPITTSEIFFLDYIDGLPVANPLIAQYWYYEYGFNYAEKIAKLMSNELLTISPIKTISKLKVPELKSILEKKGLSQSGKKAELVERIQSSISPEELSTLFEGKEEYYAVTVKGMELVNSVVPSATKSLELENDCISFILQRNFDAAYREIAKFRKDKPGSSGLGMDWSYEFERGLNKFDNKIYTEIFDNRNYHYTLRRDRELEDAVRASLIFCRMMGLSQDKYRKLIKRVFIEAGKDYDDDAQKLFHGKLL